MISSIKFENFKVLKDATLPLGRFTLIVGPNGSGKSTALQAFDFLRVLGRELLTPSVGMDKNGKKTEITISVELFSPMKATVKLTGVANQSPTRNYLGRGMSLPASESQFLDAFLKRFRAYSLDPENLAKPVGLQPEMELSPNGLGLAGVLDGLRDKDPEQFELLNKELNRVLPEFDRILFDTPSGGSRAFLLRTTDGHYKIPAKDLSQGTLFLTAILTLAYLPTPPPVLALEEPDRGIHPRLLRQVRDALYRLAYPEDFGESRAPTQIVATTQSPYFLDLFRDHPEEIVIAEKKGLYATFKKLTDREDIDEILAEAPLGEVWYSGILGGVPTAP